MEKPDVAHAIPKATTRLTVPDAEVLDARHLMNTALDNLDAATRHRRVRVLPNSVHWHPVANQSLQPVLLGVTHRIPSCELINDESSITPPASLSPIPMPRPQSRTAASLVVAPARSNARSVMG
jgi:hypothetical protein